MENIYYDFNINLNIIKSYMHFFKKIKIISNTYIHTIIILSL